MVWCNAVIALGVSLSLVKGAVITSDAYASSLSVDAIMGHLRVLQGIADGNANTRSHGTAGYAASADYIFSVAKEAGLDVQRQPVPSPVGIVKVGTLIAGGVTYQAPDVTVDFYTNTTDAAGITTELTALPGYGCTEEEFANTANMTVMVKNGGNCETNEKTFNSLRGGNVAIILYDETPQPLVSGAGKIVNPPDGVVVPVVLKASYDVAQALLKLQEIGPAQATVNVQVSTEDVASDNIIAQTKWGDANKVIMIGSHLDSVFAGPGINDNGSGSATLAELAIQLAQFTGTHVLRFGWWSTEERGIVGSTRYVEQLSQSERDKIVAYINLDMTASPNYVLGVQDNDNSGGGRPPWLPAPPAGSNAIERILQGAFVSLGLNHTGFAVASNSDHAPFLEVGIPAGGLAAGAGARKTDIEAELFGGTAGERYDNCYHSACDTIENISQNALIHNARAAARALALLANDVSAIEEERNGGVETSRLRVVPDLLTDLGKHESH